MKQSLLAGLMPLLCAGLSFAQSAQSIQGLVEDSTGAVVAGARVRMTNMGTGISSSAESNSAGLFNFPLVQVGNYCLIA